MIFRRICTTTTTTIFILMCITGTTLAVPVTPALLSRSRTTLFVSAAVEKMVQSRNNWDGSTLKSYCGSTPKPSPAKRQGSFRNGRTRGIWSALYPYLFHKSPPVLSMSTGAPPARKTAMVLRSSTGGGDDNSPDMGDSQAELSAADETEGTGNWDTAGERDRESEEEGRWDVQPVIDLPVDGVLLQLFPAVLIGVLGIVLTLLVNNEAARFDGEGGGGGNGVVVVKDLRERTTQ